MNDMAQIILACGGFVFIVTLGCGMAAFLANSKVEYARTPKKEETK